MFNIFLELGSCFTILNIYKYEYENIVLRPVLQIQFDSITPINIIPKYITTLEMFWNIWTKFGRRISVKDFHYCRPPFFVLFQSSTHFASRPTVPSLPTTSTHPNKSIGQMSLVKLEEVFVLNAFHQTFISKLSFKFQIESNY